MATHLETPTVRRFERLAYLGDHTVAKGMIDPRGWKVVDGHAQPVGEVRDLIVDTDRMVAAFIDIELDGRFFALRGDPRVLVPMLHADRDGKARRLIVPELTRSRVGALLLARDEYQLNFWKNWWHADATLDDSIEPVPHAYTPAFHEDDDPVRPPDETSSR